MLKTEVAALLAVTFLPCGAGADPAHATRTLSGHTGGVAAIAFSPDGSLLASGGWDRLVRIRRVSDGKLVRSFTPGTGPVFALAYSPDGRILATGNPKTKGSVKLWDAADGTLIRTIEGTSYCSSMSFSPDGKRLAAAEHNTIRLWNVADGTLARTLEGHAHNVFSIAYSPDGKRLGSGGWDRTARLWNADTGETMHVYAEHGRAVNAVTFSHDGKWLLTGSDDGAIRVWRTSDGNRVMTLGGYGSRILSVGLAEDNRRAIAGTSEHSALGSDLQTIDDLRVGPSVAGSTTCIAFSPDGKLLATGGMDGVVRLIPTDSIRARQAGQSFASPACEGGPGWKPPL
jgi:WD40 repeat protein